jgi:transcriptional regulator with XRE-family HTH domain
MDLREVFAVNLRHLRHAKGLSQDDLAYEAEISRSYLSQLEKGSMSAFIALNVWLYRVSGGRMMGRKGAGGKSASEVPTDYGSNGEITLPAGLIPAPLVLGAHIHSAINGSIPLRFCVWPHRHYLREGTMPTPRREALRT